MNPDLCDIPCSVQETSSIAKTFDAEIAHPYIFSEIKFLTNTCRKFNFKKGGAVVVNRLKSNIQKIQKTFSSYFSMIVIGDTIRGNICNISLMVCEELRSKEFGSFFRYILNNVFFTKHTIDRFEERCIEKDVFMSLDDDNEDSNDKKIIFSTDTMLDKLSKICNQCLMLNEIWFNRIGTNEIYVKLNDYGILSIHKYKDFFVVKTFLATDMVNCFWRELNVEYSFDSWLKKAFKISD